MAHRPVLITAEEVADLVRTGDWITMSGFGGLTRNAPIDIMQAIEVRFLTDGEPRDLTWFEIFPSINTGIEPLAHAGLLKRVFHNTWTGSVELQKLINANQVDGYSIPLATASFWMQQMAAGRDGYLTPVGVETCVDPRNGGARMHPATQEEYISLVEAGGQEYLWYKKFNIDLAVLTGTTVDEAGNLSMEEEHFTTNILQQALAAKQHDGKVVVRASKLVREGEIHPRMVEVPGALVDYLVVDPKWKPGIYGWGESGWAEMKWTPPPDRQPPVPPQLLALGDPAALEQWMLEGVVDEGRVAAGTPLIADRLISRRAAMEWKPDKIVNCGQGIAIRGMIPVCVEEEIDQAFELSVELGKVGGVQSGFGYNNGVTSILDSPAMFSLYSTSRMQGTTLGMLEFDAQGNVNLQRYGSTWIGPGGSVDIAHFVPKVIFVGTLRAGGMEIATGEGSLAITQEGKISRAVERVQAVSFNGPKMFREGKEVLYVTERAVFRLTQNGPQLIEIAPGVDLDHDILSKMEFRPEVASDLKIMDPRIFRKGRMGLRQDWGLPPSTAAAPAH